MCRAAPLWAGRVGDMADGGRGCAEAVERAVKDEWKGELVFKIPAPGGGVQRCGEVAGRVSSSGSQLSRGAVVGGILECTLHER